MPERESDVIDDEILSFAQTALGNDKLNDLDAFFNRIAAAYLARVLRWAPSDIESRETDAPYCRFDRTVEIRYVQGLRPEVVPLLISTLDAHREVGCIALVCLDFSIKRVKYLGFVCRDQVRDRLRELEGVGPRVTITFRMSEVYRSLPFEPVDPLVFANVPEEEIWKSHFPAESRRVWRDAGFDACEAITWAQVPDGSARFTLPQALVWKGCGFSALEAFEWSTSVSGAYLKPEQAAEYRKAGFSPSSAATWAMIDLSASDAGEAQALKLSQQDMINLQASDLTVRDARIASEWLIRLDAKSIARLAEWRNVCLNTAIAAPWMAMKFEPGEAREWFAASITRPDEANEFKAAGIAPADAREWLMVCKSAREAIDWSRAGFTPLFSASWIRAGFEPRVAEDWAGFSHKDVALALDANIPREDVDEWQKCGFSIFETSMWYTRGMDALAFRKFLDAGFEPATARYLVAERLNDDPATYRLWKAAGFSDDEMSAWAEWSLAEAEGWKAWDFDPDEALRWNDLEASEAADWRAAGFSSDAEAMTWKRKGFDANEAAKMHFGRGLDAERAAGESSWNEVRSFQGFYARRNSRERLMDS